MSRKFPTMMNGQVHQAKINVQFLVVSVMTTMTGKWQKLTFFNLRNVYITLTT